MAIPLPLYTFEGRGSDSPTTLYDHCGILAEPIQIRPDIRRDATEKILHYETFQELFTLIKIRNLWEHT